MSLASFNIILNFTEHNRMIESSDDMQHLANEWGFLPFFAGPIPGFSIEENIDPRWWFSDGSLDEENEDDLAQSDPMGAWDWKGRCIIEGDLAYGKFFHGKAGYISMEFFPDFINYRRSKYKLSAQEKKVLATLRESHSLLSSELRLQSGYERRHYTHRESNPLLREAQKTQPHLPKPKKTTRVEGFETAISRLQMGGRALIADFEYRYDKQGRRYGWGVARYSTPEDFFGEDRISCSRKPLESYSVLLNRLTQLFPDATPSQLKWVLG